jgi:hypothetical protein
VGVSVDSVESSDPENPGIADGTACYSFVEREINDSRFGGHHFILPVSADVGISSILFLTYMGWQNFL